MQLSVSATGYLDVSKNFIRLARRSQASLLLSVSSIVFKDVLPLNMEILFLNHGYLDLPTGGEGNVLFGRLKSSPIVIPLKFSVSISKLPPPPHNFSLASLPKVYIRDKYSTDFPLPSLMVLKMVIISVFSRSSKISVIFKKFLSIPLSLVHMFSLKSLYYF